MTSVRLRRPRAVLVPALVAAVLALTGCGGSAADDAGSEAAGSATASPTGPESGGSPADSGDDTGDDGHEDEGHEDGSGAKQKSPGPDDTSGTTVEITVTGDSVRPVAKAVEVEVGDTVRLDVRADRAGSLHVHSTPEHEFDFGPGSEQFRFTLGQPGTVDVEEHESGALVLRILAS